MFKVGVGHGIDPDSAGAIEEVLEQCEQALGGETPTAGILLSAIDFEHEAIILRIRQTYPNITLIGGTSVGELSSEMGFQQDSLTLMLFCSDEVTFQAGAGKRSSADAIAAAKEAIAQANQHPSPAGNKASGDNTPEPLKLCYVLGDGLLVDAVAMVNGLREATANKVPIIGGLTADDWKFKNTYQFISTPEATEILQDSVVVLTFAGNLKVSYSVASGQRPIGPKATVTKSTGGTIYEIDDRPAIDFYVSTLGIEEVKLAGGGGWAGAVAVYEQDSTKFYLRAPNGNAHADGSVTFFGHITEHSTIQLVETDNNSLLASAKEAFQVALSAYSGEAPAAALLVSCASRLKALGTRVDQEYALTQECLSHPLPMIGFYSFGEISPFTEQTLPHFHNETFVALLLGTH